MMKTFTSTWRERLELPLCAPAALAAGALLLGPHAPTVNLLFTLNHSFREATFVCTASKAVCTPVRTAPVLV